MKAEIKDGKLTITAESYSEEYALKQRKLSEEEFAGFIVFEKYKGEKATGGIVNQINVRFGEHGCDINPLMIHALCKEGRMGKYSEELKSDKECKAEYVLVDEIDLSNVEPYIIDSDELTWPTGNLIVTYGKAGCSTKIYHNADGFRIINYDLCGVPRYTRNWLSSEYICSFIPPFAVAAVKEYEKQKAMEENRKKWANEMIRLRVVIDDKKEQRRSKEADDAMKNKQCECVDSPSKRCDKEGDFVKAYRKCSETKTSSKTHIFHWESCEPLNLGQEIECDGVVLRVVENGDWKSIDTLHMTKFKEALDNAAGCRKFLINKANLERDEILKKAREDAEKIKKKAHDESIIMSVKNGIAIVGEHINDFAKYNKMCNQMLDACDKDCKNEISKCKKEAEKIIAEAKQKSQEASEYYRVTTEECGQMIAECKKECEDMVEKANAKTKMIERELRNKESQQAELLNSALKCMAYGPK